MNDPANNEKNFADSAMATPARIAAIQGILDTLKLAPDGHAVEIEALSTSLVALRLVDEADRLTGQVMRRLQVVTEQQAAMTEFMENAKRDAGYDPSVSFADVWADLLRRVGSTVPSHDGVPSWISDEMHSAAEVAPAPDTVAEPIRPISGALPADLSQPTKF